MGGDKSGSKRFFQRDFHFQLESFPPVKTSANLIILAPYFDSKAPPPADSFNYYTYTLVPAYPGNSLVFLGCPPLAPTVKNSSCAGAARNNATPSRLVCRENVLARF